MDVTVVSASSVDGGTIRMRAARDGAAAARAEDTKRVRYPGPQLIPFAIEALGRPGACAETLMRTYAPEELSERSAVLGSAWQDLSVIIQTANAELILAAAGAQ